MSVAISTLVLLGVLVAVVVATLVVENWGQLRQPLDVDEPGVDEPDVDVDTEGAAAPEGRVPVPGADAAAPAPAGDRGPARVEVPVSDRTVAVLFASYATARLPEDRRAAAWVTASARPPRRAGEVFRPGALLRGRPAAVQQLLDCDDEGRCWVTLNTDVDIELGVTRRPPRCPVLAALVQLWAASRSLPTELDVETTAALRRAVGRLGPTWSTTTGARSVMPLARALRNWTPEEGPRLVLVDPASRRGPTAAAGTRAPDVANPVGSRR